MKPDVIPNGPGSGKLTGDASFAVRSEDLCFSAFKIECLLLRVVLC
jgi:hypothetical protein